MTTSNRTRPAFAALAAVTLSLLAGVCLPAAAAADDPIEDVRIRTAPVAPPQALEVPEPGTLALVGLGLAGLVWRRSSKR